MNCVSSFIELDSNITGRDIQHMVYKIQQLKSSIYFTTLDRNVNAKSLIGVLSLDLKKNTRLRVNVYNDDKELAESEHRTLLKYLELVKCGNK